MISRFIVCFGVYNEENPDNTIETLQRAIEIYGKPEEILKTMVLNSFQMVRMVYPEVIINSRNIWIIIILNIY